MKLIIELEDEIVYRISRHIYNDKDKVTINDIPPLPVVYAICKAISMGQSLPNGHDRLVQAKDVKDYIHKFNDYLDEDMIARLCICVDEYVPTIIAPDKLKEDKVLEDFEGLNTLLFFTLLYEQWRS